MTASSTDRSAGVVAALSTLTYLTGGPPSTGLSSSMPMTSSRPIAGVASACSSEPRVMVDTAITAPRPQTAWHRGPRRVEADGRGAAVAQGRVQHPIAAVAGEPQIDRFRHRSVEGEQSVGDRQVVVGERPEPGPAPPHRVGDVLLDAQLQVADVRGRQPLGDERGPGRRRRRPRGTPSARSRHASATRGRSTRRSPARRSARRWPRTTVPSEPAPGGGTAGTRSSGRR